MDKQLIFFKTDQGREALTSRPAGLGPRLRSLLIMVDGKRSVAEFDKLLGADAAPLLEQLAAQGWVESDAATTGAALNGAAGAAGGAVSGVPVLTDAVPAAPALPFADARRLVVRFVNDQLGPMGEPLAMRVEGCKTPADLQAILPRVRDGLLNFKNAATVAQFDQDVASRLP
ncbi:MULTISPECIES: hypothetical protein [Hydrogenophaga]|uniref:Uncharacterized protein n=1 Tax=Hydrogenophaga intermedia TaxID=65786 RepID=A0A1L1PV31_HYDIT|nr:MULTISPECIES: hypothetical protein [Hydrogenophaga]AOS80406.1 hypothetical protein Q5W_16220 [Hydrogenophaga sp. PBC]TMU78060.1 hypothetical protein FGJ01_01575 [Hydrogenophaga intermedia]CDN88491.1 hypothetical protein BN948_02925 [Hydrogenophaga intermedia]